MKTDAADSIMLLEGKEYSLLFYSKVAISVIIIDGEWKRRRMRQNVCNRRTSCADEAKTQKGCRPEYEASPSWANVNEFVPPSFAIPSPPTSETNLIVFVSVKDGRPIEKKDIEK
jgi:hypothetical protein